MVINHRFRQIRIEKNLYLQIKGHCVSKEIKIGKFFENVLVWFFKYLAQGNHIIYHASRQKGYLMSIRLREDIIKIVSEIAEQEQLSDARIIFTALTLYLDSNSIKIS